MTWAEEVEYNKLVAKAAQMELSPMSKLRLTELSKLNTEKNRPLNHWDAKKLEKMRKPRKMTNTHFYYISFSTFLLDVEWYTQLDLIAETMTISKDGTNVFRGSLVRFKELEKIKASETDLVYKSILDMAEELIDILTKE